MNIYVAHSTGYDFRNELYEPLKKLGTEHNFIFPHEGETFTNSRETIRAADIVLAEVSYPSTGQGIELGWANDSNVPIVCLYKTGAKFSSSLSVVSGAFVEYDSSEDMVSKVQNILNTRVV